MEQQRLSVAGDANGLDLADDDQVIAFFVRGSQPAVHEGCDPLQHRSARGDHTMGNLGERVPSARPVAGCEIVGDRLLAGAEDVDGERAVAGAPACAICVRVRALR